MNSDYIKDVRRLGSSKPFVDAGHQFNLSHNDDIDPSYVQTDGAGNIKGMPLVWRKPCFGRPERYVRAAMGSAPWRDERGELRPGKTSCDSCQNLSSGTFAACSAIVDERASSSSRIISAFDKWFAGCHSYGPRCFVGGQLYLWDEFLESIEKHGGWQNVNDDQVAIESLRVQGARAERKKTNRKNVKAEQRAARQGKAKPIALDYHDKLQAETERRAEHLKGLRCLSGRSKRDMFWLKMLTDSSCERIACVWQNRELLLRMSIEPTGQEVAKRMFATNQWPLKFPSLRTRVHEDLKRLSKIEDDTMGSPLWPRWSYS